MSATTIDVSSTGMQLSVESALEVGTHIAWELRLPSEVMGTAADIAVVCQGRVAWVVDEVPVRMAVTIDQYRMQEVSL